MEPQKTTDEPEEDYIHIPEAFNKAARTFAASADKELAQEVLWHLHTECMDAIKRVIRWSAIAFIGIIIFEVLNRRLATEAVIAGIKVERLDFLMYLMPPVVAASLARTIAFLAESIAFERMFLAVARHSFSDLYSSKIAELLIANNGSIGAAIPDQFLGRRTRRPFKTMLGIQVYGFLIIPAVFEVYALTQLFMHEGASSIATWLSLATTLAFLYIALWLFIALIRNTMERS